MRHINMSQVSTQSTQNLLVAGTTLQGRKRFLQLILVFVSATAKYKYLRGLSKLDV